jgi:hypothetical protein
VLQVIGDGQGGQVLQLKVDWSTAEAGAAKAGLLIDNVRFDSSVNGAMDLGSSRISSFQINYLDMRLRPGTEMGRNLLLHRPCRWHCCWP